MDTLTHTLLGAVVVEASVAKRLHGRTHRRTLLFAAVAAAFPDIDYLSMPLDTLSFIADWHRGPTHSLVMLPLWSLLLGWFMARLQNDGAMAWFYSGVAAIAITSHIVSDLLTAWGVQLFWPFMNDKWALDTTFVIDPIFSGIVLLSLVASYKKRDSIYAVSGLAILATYVAVQAGLGMKAERIAQEYADRQGIEPTQIAVLPQPFSPTRWKLVIKEEEQYHVAHLNLLATTPPVTEGSGLVRLLRSYGQPHQLQWQRHYQFGSDDEIAFARVAWSQPAFSRYRRFASLPYRERLLVDTNRRCVWFADLRYQLPGLSPPFRFGMCEEQNQQWYRVP